MKTILSCYKITAKVDSRHPSYSSSNLFNPRSYIKQEVYLITFYTTLKFFYNKMTNINKNN